MFGISFFVQIAAAGPLKEETRLDLTSGGTTMIPEISFYLPDTPGQFARSLKGLAESQINIHGFSVELVGALSKVRFVCSDAEKAKGVLIEQGYEVEYTEVLALSIPHESGELLRVADLLGDRGVNIKYGYVTQSPHTKEALVVIKADDDHEAKRCLEQEGIRDLEAIPSRQPD